MLAAPCDYTFKRCLVACTLCPRKRPPSTSTTYDARYDYEPASRQERTSTTSREYLEPSLEFTGQQRSRGEYGAWHQACQTFDFTMLDPL